MRIDDGRGSSAIWFEDVEVPSFLEEDTWRSAFPACVRILHAMFRLPAAIEPDDLDLDPRILEALPDDVEIASWDNSTEIPSDGLRVRWRDWFLDLGLPFDASLAQPPSAFGWPPDLTHPSEGSMDDQAAVALATILSGFTTGPVTVSHFQVEPGADGSLVQPGFRCEVANVPTAVLDGQRWGYGEYWWPDDLAWVVHTDYDSSATIVAGSTALIDDVLAEEWFEAYRVAELPPGS